MSKAVVEKRRTLIEAWMVAVFAQPRLLATVMTFLEIPAAWKDFIVKSFNVTDVTESELMVYDFIAQLSAGPNHKLKALEHFENLFFSARRQLRADCLAELIAVLMPASGEAIAGARSLNVIVKLISPVHFRDHRMSVQALLSQNVNLVQAMQLQKHLTQEHSNSFQGAREVILVLYDYLLRTGQLDKLSTFLNYHEEACNLFLLNRTGSFKLSLTPSVLPLSEEWRFLLADNDLTWLKYKLVARKLVFKSAVTVRAPFATCLDYIVDPDKRMLWHCILGEAVVVQEKGDECVEVQKGVLSDYKFMTAMKRRVTRASDGSCTVKFMSDEGVAILPLGFMWTEELWYSFTVRNCRQFISEPTTPLKSGSPPPTQHRCTVKFTLECKPPFTTALLGLLQTSNSPLVQAFASYRSYVEDEPSFTQQKSYIEDFPINSPSLVSAIEAKMLPRSPIKLN
jgi:hypothetical protein